jgi:hypothetical protein
MRAIAVALGWGEEVEEDASGGGNFENATCAARGGTM